jgi:hypothetical protein
MKPFLVVAGVALGLGLFNLPAHAKGYVVNGHAASPAEVQLLASHGVPPGQWLVDGYGISPAAGPGVQSASDSVVTKCWYVLDVRLCE